MRAVVIEIHKNYCIALTSDGRFIKQPVEQGELEIGDEIMVERLQADTGRYWIKTLAIAASAALVIGLGAWGYFKMSGLYEPPGERQAAAAEEEKSASDENIMVIEQEAPREEEASESGDMALEVKKVEGLQAGEGEIDEVFEIAIEDIGQPVEVVAGNLLFMYWISMAEEESELLLVIENLDTELLFTGNIEVSVLSVEGILSGEKDFELKDFGREDKVQDFISVIDGTDFLQFKIKGIFE